MNRAAFWHVAGTAPSGRSTSGPDGMAAATTVTSTAPLGSGGGDRTRNTQLQRLLFCRLNYPRRTVHGNARRGWRGGVAATRVARLMGSLIKKRRKRMRKKKHKKMLKRTRWQRRAAGK